MKPILSLKSLYRSPVRTLLTFILLAIVTFAFFSQTAEIAITSREFDTSARRYYGVGTVADASEESNPAYSTPIFEDPRTDEMPQTGLKAYAAYREVSRYSPITDAHVKSLFSLPHITYGDARYMTAGVSDAYFRPDDGKGFYNYSTRCVIEATLDELILGPDLDPNSAVIVRGDTFFNQLVVGNIKLLAGNPVIHNEENPIMVWADFEKIDNLYPMVTLVFNCIS